MKVNYFLEKKADYKEIMEGNTSALKTILPRSLGCSFILLLTKEDDIRSHLL